MGGVGEHSGALERVSCGGGDCVTVPPPLRWLPVSPTPHPAPSVRLCPKSEVAQLLPRYKTNTTMCVVWGGGVFVVVGGGSVVYGGLVHWGDDGSLAYPFLVSGYA